MLLDILITIIAILIVIYGYRKGFIIQFFNFVFALLYLYFANTYLEVGLNLINDQHLNALMEENIIYRYLVIVLLGIILFFILNFILRKIFKIRILSFFNRLGGILISLIIVYLLISFLNLVIFFVPENSFDLGDIKNSFYLGKDFNQYNILLRWWFNE